MKYNICIAAQQKRSNATFKIILQPRNYHMTWDLGAYYYSHSIVAGGLLEISYVTLEIFGISLIILLDTFSKKS